MGALGLSAYLSNSSSPPPPNVTSVHALRTPRSPVSILLLLAPTPSDRATFDVHTPACDHAGSGAPLCSQRSATMKNVTAL